MKKNILFLIMAGALLLVAMPSLARDRGYAKIDCVAKTPVQVNVLPSKSHVKYNFTKSKAELNSFDVDTISPYGPQHKTTVSGLMSGAIQVRNQVEFLHEKYEQIGQGCLYLKTVSVTIHIDPTIYIAREYPKGSCYHNAVLTHEMKHVREDQLIVNKYVHRIGRSLKEVIESQSSAYGPYRIEDLSSTQDNIQNSINKVVKSYNDTMNLERRRRQQAIDNLEEYESIGAQCRHEQG